jgi:hypothetical protein
MGKIFAVCAGGLIAGESLLVLLFMNYPPIKSSRTFKNVALALVDIALGVLLVLLSVVWTGNDTRWLLYSAGSVLMVTHLYREAEYLSGRTKPFAATRGLFVFNNIRIALLLSLIGK